MNCRKFVLGVFSLLLLALTGLTAPVIDPLPAVTVPAGKSLILPITATSPSGRTLTYTITSSTNAFAVVLHTNNPFWQLTVAQAAAANAPGAYPTPYRGGLATVTNVGTLTFLLFPEYAPHTINVFQGLTTSGFYNSNTIFHRVVSDFVIQGGDPNSNGTGGLVFQYADEFNPQAIFSGNGQLALANSGPNTDGSQFFVTVGEQRFLDFTYTIFGQLVRGFNVLTNINNTLVDANDRPLADEIIQTASYVSNTTDTVVTLCATNVPGNTNSIISTGTITVIADDGQGGRATNTFAISSYYDPPSYLKPFYNSTALTNLVVPVNTTMTNFISATELNGANLSWYEEGSPANPATYSSAFLVSNSVLQTLTYNVTNQGGLTQWLVTPANNFVGILNVAVEVYTEYAYYDFFNLVFGDTPIAGQTNSVIVRTVAPFTNALLATFTNGVPGSAVTNFTASINWGDDTITAGTINTNGTGQKIVLGAHTYAWPGSYPVYVTVQSSIGASTTFLSFISASSAAPWLTLPASPALTTNGFAFNLQPANGLNGLIQISTNLLSWTTLTNFTGASTVLTFLDSSATNGTRRFYRAVIP